MNRVQLAIFPAILVGILFILGATQLISSPRGVLAANQDMVAQAYTNSQQPESDAAGSGLGGGGASGVYSPATTHNEPSAAGSTQVPVVEPIFVDVNVPSSQKGLLAAGSTNTNGCTLSGNFPASVLQWCGLIEKYARQNGLEPGLIAALITQESGGDANAYSSSGAVGLMQVMPRDGVAASFMCPSGPCFSERPSSSQLTQPEYNIAYGTKMLAELVGKYGSVREALKNYGPIDVGYYYADLVLGIFSSHP